MKAVIVAAGYGTRFLPITRCVPKEMLPIVDRPAIALVIDELVEAGVDRLLVITSRRKRAMEDWFDRDPELEAALSGDARKLALIEPPDVRVEFVRQQTMGGTGDALLLAREFAGDDPVVVAYPDDLFGPGNPTRELVDAWRTTRTSVLLAQPIEGDVSRYGVLDVDGGKLRKIVEKPAPGAEPSHLVSWGRYLFTPDFFESLAALRRNHTAGEYYHIGAINALAARGRVHVHVTTAPRRDIGTPLGYVQAVIEAGLARPDIGPELRAWLGTLSS
jgi:UTP--glucose-1-phosphate uridylyltransferase